MFAQTPPTTAVPTPFSTTPQFSVGPSTSPSISLGTPTQLTTTTFSTPNTSGSAFATPNTSLNTNSTPSFFTPSAPPTSLFTPSVTPSSWDSKQPATPNPAAPTSLPLVPGYTKFSELPQHIRDALVSLEKLIKETSHKAAIPTAIINKNLQQLSDQVKGIEKLYQVLQSFEEMKEKGSTLFSDLELALLCLEKFKNPAMRHTLYLLDEPIQKFFEKSCESFNRTLALLKSRIETERNSNTNLDFLLNHPDQLLVQLKTFAKSIINISAECSVLESLSFK